MRHLFSFLVFTLLLFVLANAASSFAASDAPSLEAIEPNWLEQRQDAASFAYDWLIDLDNGDYEAAARSYRVDADTEESKKILRGVREETGQCTGREFAGAVVFAVATDKSEHKVRVVYRTDCSRKNVTETMEILLWPKASAVLRYTVEKR